MTHTLEADSIQLEFGMRTILSNIHLRCETGAITGLLGRNGEGKSCLLRILYGDLPAASRSVRFDGRSVPESYRHPELLRYLPQFNFIPGALSLSRILRDFQLEFRELEQRFPEFGPAHRRPVRELSGGQQRLIHLYIILRSPSRFALLDEPFTHLMPLQIEKVKEMLTWQKIFRISRHSVMHREFNLRLCVTNRIFKVHFWYKLLIMTLRILCFLAFVLSIHTSRAQSPSPSVAGDLPPRSAEALRKGEQAMPVAQGKLAVIGYYAGSNTAIDSFGTEKLTHIIFSFCHLKGNRLNVNNANDTATIRHLVSLKKKNPGLKVILSLGGWGGCKTCPFVFSTDSGRREFVRSLKKLTTYFHTDGIDLDWEYPALVNVPGYPFGPEDKDNFTALIRLLRTQLGKENEISFAAGGYTDYLRTSIDWKHVAPLVNYINLMTYDLVNGYSTVTGHHTALYSTPEEVESTDHAVRWLDSAGVPLSKIAIGMAFYARVFRGVDSINNGLYRPCQFFRGVSYREQSTIFSPDSGWVYHWDPVAKAPYMYNARQQLFASFDDTLSIRLKTEYALHKGLGGVMFWQLTEDRFTGGLLDVIDATKKSAAAERKN